MVVKAGSTENLNLHRTEIVNNFVDEIEYLFMLNKADKKILTLKVIM